MATMRTDSPLSRRIVLSFLDFLDAVEIAPGGDKEGLEVASQCLSDVFGIATNRSTEEQLSPNLLINLFRSAGLDPSTSSNHSEPGRNDTQTSSKLESSLPESSSKASADPSCTNNGGAVNEDLARISIREACPKSSIERLFEEFREGLESAGHFDGLTKGTSEYLERLHEARSSFEETVKKLGSSSSMSEQTILAEAFKIQGNSSMSLCHYTEAIDLYTLAISLYGDNAVYYSNRAAAHTQIGKYEEAIGDCNKAIQIDPNYSKAYSRLGLAYYAQGKYLEAIENGFKKALSLDPNSQSIRENLQAAQQKLDEERQQNRRPQTQQNQQPHENQNGEQGFTASFPFSGQLPPQMENLIPGIINLAAPQMENLIPGMMNFATQFSSRDHHTQGPQGNDSGNQNMDEQPEVRMDGNINLTFDGEHLPPEVAGFVQSMMQMFAGSQRQSESSPGNGPTEGNETRRD